MDLIPGGMHPRSSARSIGAAALMLTMVAVTARYATFGNPVLGFDEQFYLLVGDRMLHGAIPYVDIFDRKPIGLFIIFAAIRAIGGDGFLAYKLVALGFVVATSTFIFSLSRRLAGGFAALVAASLYIAWLNFMEGEGGQSPVFYNVAMIAAAVTTLAAIERPGAVRSRGALAMLIVGLALQIKYSVVFEGMYFGVALVWASWRNGERGLRSVGSIALWVGCALLPTALALLAYTAAGQFDAFWFCNFVSVLAQRHRDAIVQIVGLSVILGILSPLILTLATAPIGRVDTKLRLERRFVQGWLGASILGVLLFGRFASPHYAMPILVPLTVLLAPAFDGTRARRIAGVALCAAALILGQVVLALTVRSKGGMSAARAVAAAAHVSGGCLYVYDGYPALYMLTRSCLPTRWAFPGSLNSADEANPRALGIDPAQEVARIMASRPDAVVDDYPRFDQGNLATRAVLARALATDYFLSDCIASGLHRTRLVYRRNTEGRRQPTGTCPDAASLALPTVAAPSAP